MKIDPDLATYLQEQGFIALKPMNGIVYGVCKYMFTWGLCTHVTWTQMHYHRWCFPSPLSARLALVIWNGEGDPPGPWKKQKYMVERHNPLLYTHKGGTWYERNDTPESATWEDLKNVDQAALSLVVSPAGVEPTP